MFYMQHPIVFYVQYQHIVGHSLLRGVVLVFMPGTRKDTGSGTKEGRGGAGVGEKLGGRGRRGKGVE